MRLFSRPAAESQGVSKRMQARIQLPRLGGQDRGAVFRARRQSGTVKIHTEFKSRPPFEPSASIMRTSEEKIRLGNPYWIFARREREEKLFELTLPAALLQDAPTALDIQWVDYLR